MTRPFDIVQFTPTFRQCLNLAVSAYSHLASHQDLVNRSDNRQVSLAVYICPQADILPVKEEPGLFSFDKIVWADKIERDCSHHAIGDSADIDFGDLLDYLGGDPSVRSILLYVESIQDARKFMSAARSAARNKPVLVVKAGRVAEGARAAASHTGALAGAAAVIAIAVHDAVGIWLRQWPFTSPNRNLNSGATAPARRWPNTAWTAS